MALWCPSPPAACARFQAMSLVDIMIDQIGDARRTLEDGKPLVPVWVIKTPEGTYRVYTEFDAANPEQRERALLLVSRFMTWRLATSFVLTAEMRLSTGESGRTLSSPSAFPVMSEWGSCRGSADATPHFGRSSG